MYIGIVNKLSIKFIINLTSNKYQAHITCAESRFYFVLKNESAQ